MEKPAVAIVGSPDDPQCSTLARLIEERGGRARIIDTRDFPAKTRMTLGGPTDLRAAYVRNLHASPVAVGVSAEREMKKNWYGTLMAFREKGAFLQGWLMSLEAAGVRVVNSPGSERFGNKPFQLEVLRRAGVPVPDTLITNDPEAVRAFAARHPRVIYKPVGGGATTRPLEPRDLERLDLLAGAPVTFQEYVAGVNVRVYVVGGRVASSSLIHTSDDFDFRRAEGAAEPAELAAGVRDQCIAAARTCGFDFTSIDIRRDGDRWVFLECNTSPMWAGYDAKTDGRVGAALADLLMSSGRDAMKDVHPRSK